MPSYNEVLAAANKAGAANAPDEGAMAHSARPRYSALVGAASPQLVWEGAQKKQMTAAELVALANTDPAAVHDLMWL